MQDRSPTEFCLIIGLLKQLRVFFLAHISRFILLLEAAQLVHEKTAVVGYSLADLVYYDFLRHQIEPHVETRDESIDVYNFMSHRYKPASDTIDSISFRNWPILHSFDTFIVRLRKDNSYSRFVVYHPIEFSYLQILE